MVTIAMPVFNGEQYIRSALGSILAQTYQNLDILISDNASTDATPELCRQLAGTDRRVRYVRHSATLPPAENFDYGRAHKRGDLFMWAADDDVREPCAVARLVEALGASPEAVLAHGATRFIDPDGGDLGPVPDFDDRIGSPGVFDRIAAWTANPYRVAIYGLMRSSVVDRLPPMSPGVDADGEFLFGLMLQGPFAVVRETLLHYRLRHPPEHYEELFGKVSGDFILSRLRRLRGFAAAQIGDRATRRAALRIIEDVLREEMEGRFHWLVGELLREQPPRLAALKRLAMWVTQYPAMSRRRFTWGAVRRIVAS